MPRTLFRNFALAGAGLASCLIGLQFVRDYHMRLFAALEGFSRRPEFSLLDSLPALSPGLGELEAFKLTADPSSKTNADRSIWLADSPGRIDLEYYSGRTPFDSATFYLWTSDSVFAVRTLKGARSTRWSLPYKHEADGWTEVVGFFISRPRLLHLRSLDGSLAAFEEVGGKTLHVVRRRYRDHAERALPPDTAYPVKGPGSLELVAKGNALAIVNPSPESVRLRILRVPERRADICFVKGRSVQVYRNLLRGLGGPVLAYTSPGEIFPPGFKTRRRVDSYFWLERPLRR